MKIVFHILALCSGGYLLILAIFFFFQEKFLFFPSNAAFGNCQQMEQYRAMPIRFDDLRYYLQQKERANCWIIVFHGNAGDACDRVYFFDLLKNLNANMILFEYPGYGKDANRPGEKIFLKQALKLTQRIKMQNPDNLPIYLLGESLGTGVATWVAGQTEIEGLILFSAYTSIAAVARHHYPWLPVDRLLRNRFTADEWAKAVHAPVLLFHGVDDDIIPVEFSRKLLLNFKGDKELIEIDGCGHNDLLFIGESKIQKAISQFILMKP